MADEFRLTITGTLTNGDFNDTLPAGSYSIDQAAIGRGGSVQTIGTTVGGDIVVFGDVATAGYLYLKNLDDTNFVEYGPDTGGDAMQAMGKLKPGEPAILRMSPGVVLYAKADTDDVKLDVRLYAD
jgi:hypothetical protein